MGTHLAQRHSVMPSKNTDEKKDKYLQMLDVHIVDVLAHLEALLRHSHSMQRALLSLRSEAPPPSRPQDPSVELRRHAKEMRRAYVTLGQIIDDLASAGDRIAGIQPTERRSGIERRTEASAGDERAIAETGNGGR